MTEFQELVKTHFNSLVNEFKFELTISNDKIMVFQSEGCLIEIFHEKGQVGLTRI